MSSAVPRLENLQLTAEHNSYKRLKEGQIEDSKKTGRTLWKRKMSARAGGAVKAIKGLLYVGNWG